MNSHVVVHICPVEVVVPRVNHRVNDLQRHTRSDSVRLYLARSMECPAGARICSTTGPLLCKSDQS